MWLKLTCRLRICLKTETALRSKIAAYVNTASLDFSKRTQQWYQSSCISPLDFFSTSFKSCYTLWDDHFSPKQAIALTLTKFLSFCFHFWFMRHHHQVILPLPRDTLALAPPEATGSLWRKGELGAGILYIFVEKAPGCILIYFHPYTHTSLSARLALLWPVIKYFSAGLWHPGECGEMETNGDCMVTGFKKPKIKRRSSGWEIMLNDKVC